MAYTTINKSSLHFNTKLYTGNNGTNAITGVGFQPDLVWLKNRSSGSTYHFWTDAVRGATKTLFSNTQDAEGTEVTGLTSFDSDGFTVGAHSNINNNGGNIVSWNWKANGQGSSNTDGSVNTTYTSVNTTAGFSIVKYAGTGSAQSMGHGLGVTPKVIIVKTLTTGSTAWIFYTTAIDGSLDTLALESTAAKSDSGTTPPTSSVFYVPASSGNVNTNGRDYIAYCYAEKQGYSKFGTYVGNSNTDGSFVYTGFKPAWILAKAAFGNQTPQNQSWVIWDNKRSATGGFNENSYKLYANATDAEATSGIAQVDILSNGFKFRNSTHQSNSDNTYLYMAFAEAPIVGTNNIPATAR